MASCIVDCHQVLPGLNLVDAEIEVGADATPLTGW